MKSATSTRPSPRFSLPLVGAKNRLPGIYSAELTLAGRYENYSDTDDPAVPKIALRWQPFGESFLIRTTYSESFAAPTLYALNSPPAIGFTNSLAEFDNIQAHQITEPVESLSPSKSKNFFGGRRLVARSRCRTSLFKASTTSTSSRRMWWATSARQA